VSDLNRICLTGRLTRDPDLRKLPSGNPVCRLRIAVNGRGEDRVDYVDVSTFAKQAEVLARYLSKGSRISVDGRLNHREWEASDGTRRSGYEVVGQHVGFLDPKPQPAVDALRGLDPAPEPSIIVTDGNAPTPEGNATGKDRPREKASA